MVGQMVQNSVIQISIKINPMQLVTFNNLCHGQKKQTTSRSTVFYHSQGIIYLKSNDKIHS